ncbi:lipid A biosynthesis acyltransferase [Planctomyces sp. SCGC AG-212-M04]|nr:lipid A biosynthesis acyltransferase [Planctomyces sp. SCGC AG-212-M04]
MKFREDIQHRAVYVAFRALLCAFQMLSVRHAIQGARFFSWIMTRVLPRKISRATVAEENIRRAFGDDIPDAEVNRIIRGMWEHLFRLLVEWSQLPRKMELENCREVVVFRQRKQVLKALCSGRPVFVLGGHFGNWEVSMATFGFFGFPMGIIAREMDNPYLHDWFVHSRQRFGHKLLLKDGGWGDMVTAAEAGGNLGILCDQDAGRRGVFVDFFGSPASTFKSIALMAMQYNALLVMGYGIRLPDDLENARWSQFEIGCEEVIDPLDYTDADAVKQITQRFTSALERSIRRAPEQYFWVHRRWKTDSVTKKKAVKIAEKKAA